jgi:H+/Cl- antiporter ClcA
MGLEGPSLSFGSTIGDAVRRRMPRWTAGTDARTLLVAGAAACIGVLSGLGARALHGSFG